jgi:hypothetical protein
LRWALVGVGLLRGEARDGWWPGWEGRVVWGLGESGLGECGLKRVDWECADCGGGLGFGQALERGCESGWFL